MKKSAHPDNHKEEIKMKLRPLLDKVVLKKVEAVEVTKTGILLPGTAQEKPQVAEVVAVGPGAYSDDGKLIPMEVKIGDKVITSKYTGTEVKMDGTEYTIVKQSDILAIVE